VGPVWQGGSSGEAELLASCYRRALEVADSLGARSLAFPAISTGVFGFPVEPAAEVAIRTLHSTNTKVEVVRLVAFDTATFTIYQQLLSRSPTGKEGP
jgi:O-acetyl-ADP-ribose deacetylase (regulator of RNase III)